MYNHNLIYSLSIAHILDSWVNQNSQHLRGCVFMEMRFDDWQQDIHGKTCKTSFNFRVLSNMRYLFGLSPLIYPCPWRPYLIVTSWATNDDTLRGAAGCCPICWNASWVLNRRKLLNLLQVAAPGSRPDSFKIQIEPHWDRGESYTYHKTGMRIWDAIHQNRIHNIT
jgi:hypothetical protein